MSDTLAKEAGTTGVTGITPVSKLSSPQPAPIPRPLFLHCALFLGQDYVLGDETFRLVAFEGKEGVSEPFEFQLELHANTNPRYRPPLQFDAVIGRGVTVGIQYWDERMPPYLFQGKQHHNYINAFRDAIGGQRTGKELALFNGIVSAFAMEQPGVYRATMKPALWKLTLTNGYCVYSQKNIRDVIRAVLERHHFQAEDFSLDAVDGLAVSRVQDWLQAGETDYDFLQRLMAKAHIYYYFAHSGRRHKLVFANRAAYRKVFADDQPLRYTHTDAGETGMAQCDVITRYSYQQSLTSSGVRGVFTRQHAAWEEVTVAGFETYQTPSQDDPGELPFNQYKIYQYGCSSDEVEEYAKSTHALLETSASRLGGASLCPHLRVGHSFVMTGAESYGGQPSPIRPSLEGKRFVLTSVSHRANLDGSYQNEFEAGSGQGVISPFSIAETQQGAVVAKVVAKPGGTVPANWRYYDSGNFTWSVKNLSDATAVAGERTLGAKGVYVRFSTDAPGADPTWVKLAPHMQSAPEIGVSVLVARAQDESELPEIQSIVQSNGALDVIPDDRSKLSWTANTRVGSAYSTQYGDGISIRFGGHSTADLAAAIKLVEGKYDKTPARFKDAGYSQGGSYSFSCSEKDRDRTSDENELFGPFYAGAEDMLSAGESFGSTYNRRYGKVSSEFSNIGKSYSNSTTGDTDHTTKITGVNRTMTTMTTSRETNHIGSQSVSTAIGARNSNDLVGVSNNNSLTGLTNSNAAHLIAANVNLGVSSNELSMILKSTSMTIKSTAFDVSSIGTTSTVTLVGTANKVEVIGPGLVYEGKPSTAEIKSVATDIKLLSAIKLLL